MKNLFKHKKPEDKEFRRIHFNMSVLRKKQNEKSTLSGKGIPSNKLGNDGDYYVDKETKNFYIKENGKWL